MRHSPENVRVCSTVIRQGISARAAESEHQPSRETNRHNYEDAVDYSGVRGNRVGSADGSLAMDSSWG